MKNWDIKGVARPALRLGNLVCSSVRGQCWNPAWWEIKVSLECKGTAGQRMQDKGLDVGAGALILWRLGLDSMLSHPSSMLVE